MKMQELKVTYQSPEGSETFQRSLPSLPDDSGSTNVQSKTAFLSALRTAIAETQSDVNAYLTRQMELEKASQSDTAKKSKTKEDEEEERYGEEDLEGDS